jgi:WD40 repeat protein
MTWPLSQDYNEAIQCPADNFADADLRRGQATTNPFGVPMPYSGNFADVYQVRCSDGTRWAVKCFTREVAGLRERYAKISQHLRRARLPFTVDFSYLERGIRVAGHWFPVLKMEWVEGLTLNQFVAQYADKPDTLEGLLHVWARMGRHLRAAGVAHGDLQHGNVLLVPESGTSSLAVKLVDYDGMWVPALARKKPGEVGHPCYQHPRRAPEKVYSLEVDRFPLLLVATALRALKAGGRVLWEKYDSGDNLLFTQQDLEAPSKSRLFYELLKQDDPEVRYLTEALIGAARNPLDQTPLLEELMPDIRPARAKPPVAVAVGVMAPPGPIDPLTPSGRTARESDEVEPETRPAASRAGRLMPDAGGVRARTWVAGAASLAAVLIVFLGVAGAIYLAGPSQGQKSSKPALAQSQGQKSSKPALAQSQGQESSETALAQNRPTDTQRHEGVTEPPIASQPVHRDNSDQPKVDVTPKVRELFTVGGHTGWVIELVLSPDCLHLASVGKGRLEKGEFTPGEVKIWNLKTGAEVFTLRGHAKMVSGACYSPDGRHLATYGSDGVVKLWGAATGQEECTLKGHTAGIHSACFASDSTRLASAGGDGTVRLWDTLSGKEIRAFGLAGYLRSVCFSPDGACLAAASDGAVKAGELTPGELRAWDTGSGKEVLTLKGEHSGYSNVCFSPDGTRLASACESSFQRGSRVPGRLKVWDTRTGQELLSLDGHGQGVQGAQYSADGTRFAAGGSGTANVWDARTGRELLNVDETLAGGGSLVRSSFSRDGMRLATTFGREVKIWQVPTTPPGLPATRPVSVDGQTAGVGCVCFTPDGETLAAGGLDGTVKVWSIGRQSVQSGDGGKTEPPAGAGAKMGGTKEHRDTPATEDVPPQKDVPRASAGTSPAVGAADPRPKVPDEASLATAEQEIGEAHKAEYAKKTPADMQALASLLLKEGVEAKDKPAMRFVLLREARDLAARAGDLLLSLQAAEQMAKHFAVNTLEMKAAGLEAATRTAATPSIRLNAAILALALADDAEESNNYEMGERLAKMAQASAATLTGLPVAVATQARLKEASAVRKAYQSVQEASRVLADKHDDPDANLAVGKFHALSRCDWDRGLALLARGSNPKLRALAEADLASPANAKGAEEMGDLYTGQAEAESGAAKAHLLCRACYWYDQATSKLSGVDRSRVEQKTAAIEKALPPSRPVVLHARCGAYKGWADVTDRVRWMVSQSSGFKLVVKLRPGDLGIPDPSYGEHKSLFIVYRYRGGVHLSITGDADTVSIPAAPGTFDTAPPGRPAPGQELVVLYARYGNESTYADATAKAQAAVKGKTLSASPGTLQLGDPYNGRHKSFIIVYREDGRVRLSTTSEDDTVRLGGESAKP